MGEKVVTYYRVSTERQGRSGLGLEAQREAVRRHMVERGCSLVRYRQAGQERGAEFEEVETGKGCNALDKRPQLREAIAVAKRHKATLLIAKLDRLARNVHFVSGLMETGVQFRCCDLPTDDRTMIHFYAVMAEAEGRRISHRISEALQAKKLRGESVGNVANLRAHNISRAKAAADFAGRLQPTLRAFVAQGMPQRAMVEALNASGTRTSLGGRWSLVQLQRVLARAT